MEKSFNFIQIDRTSSHVWSASHLTISWRTLYIDFSTGWINLTLSNFNMADKVSDWVSINCPNILPFTSCQHWGVVFINFHFKVYFPFPFLSFLFVKFWKRQNENLPCSMCDMVKIDSWYDQQWNFIIRLICVMYNYSVPIYNTMSWMSLRVYGLTLEIFKNYFIITCTSTKRYL